VLWPVVRYKTTRLALEVQGALESDPLYGPKHDRWRHTVGIEYEVVLEDMLQAMGTSDIAFGIVCMTLCIDPHHIVPCYFV